MKKIQNVQFEKKRRYDRAFDKVGSIIWGK